MNENDINLVENSKSEVLIGGEISKIDPDKFEKQDNDKDNEEEKKLLIYKIQSVSVWKLICHLSGKLEIFLMIIGLFSTLFSSFSIDSKHLFGQVKLSPNSTFIKSM